MFAKCLVYEKSNKEQLKILIFFSNMCTSIDLGMGMEFLYEFLDYGLERNVGHMLSNCL
jgi:hypothetical protein